VDANIFNVDWLLLKVTIDQLSVELVSHLKEFVKEASKNDNKWMSLLFGKGGVMMHAHLLAHGHVPMAYFIRQSRRRLVH
jgi:hypothetical protein